ncbi:MAG: MFS transporter [Gammaproteobacteria bacterium]|jgi:MFS family permease
MSINLRLSLPRTVIVLGFVSLLNDSASEMITPLLPVFLTLTLGAGPGVVGLVEGIAEATASILKLISGYLADRGVNPRGLVLSGYSTSNVARPLIGLAVGWWWVLLLRFLDRVGKGLRTAPRDAMIAVTTDAAQRGRAFGFHRALDNAGAMVGPLLAFALLGMGLSMGHVFLASVLPGLLVIGLLVFGLPPEAARLAPPTEERDSQRPARWRWQSLDARLKGLILASGGLALATTPEAFLVLWAEARGLEVVWVPLIWAAASAVKAVVAAPAGALSDHVGRLPVVVIGWTLRVGLLLALGLAGSETWVIWGLFLAYAGALAFTEGAERALIGDFAPERLRATAFGVYHLVTGVFVLPGAVMFGLIWQWLGERAAFSTAAVLTLLAAIAMLVVLRLDRRHQAG